MAKLTLALFQCDSHAGDKAAQLTSLQNAARQARDGGADLLITPELYMAGYNIGDLVHELAEPEDGPFMGEVSELARDCGIHILCAFAERATERIYNSATLFGTDGSRLFTYRKLHLSGAYEKATFETGDDVLTARIAGVTVAPLICYDVEFPEAVRSVARAGAEVVCVPTALREQYAHLAETMIPTRAFENGLYVAYVNQAGAEGDWHYCGKSRLAGPDGRIVATAGAGQELVFATAESERIAAARAELPYLEDLRPDLMLNRP